MTYCRVQSRLRDDLGGASRELTPTAPSLSFRTPLTASLPCRYTICMQYNTLPEKVKFPFSFGRGGAIIGSIQERRRRLAYSGAFAYREPTPPSGAEILLPAGTVLAGRPMISANTAPRSSGAAPNTIRATRSPNDQERLVNGVSLSWLHHKGRNRHHFEYWIDYCRGQDGTPFIGGCKMPVKYVAEMFCDRIAACRVYQKEKYTDASPYDYFQHSKGICAGRSTVTASSIRRPASC